MKGKHIDLRETDAVRKTMKIDLHCHTKRCKKGDSPKRSVCPSKFKKAIESAQVEIVAITNHNTFDQEQFDSFSGEVGQDVQLWPGVELDVCGSREKSHWHMLVIASPSKEVEFNDAMRRLVGVKPANDVLVSVESVFRTFKDVEPIFISHACDKKPYLTQDDIDEMEGLVQESERWRLFFEPRSLVTVGIWTNHGFNMMLGSDVQDWDNYPGCELPELRLPVDSFEQFCLLAKRDGRTIETLLGKRGSFNVVAHPHENVDVHLTLREDINVLFGQKGTGKTEILRSIECALTAKGKSCCSYYGNEKHEGFSRLLSTDGLDREPANFGRSDGVQEIADILGWSDVNPTPLSAYVTWWNTRGNNKNKKRFKLSEAQILDEVSTVDFESDQKASDSVSKFTDIYLSRGYGKYLRQDDAEELYKLLVKLDDGITSKSREHFIEYRSVELANEALESIKKEIDAKSDTKSKPSSTGFLAFVRARIRLRENAEKLIYALRPLDSGQGIERSYLGDLDDKGSAYVVTRYRYLAKESRASEFGTSIRGLREWERALRGLCDGALSTSAYAKQQAFADLCNEYSISDLSPFIGIDRYVALGMSDEKYVPSSGEEGILLLGHKLDADADVYVLDEAELGMSNSYVDSVIRGRIQKLALLGKTIVLATHNANLAVRTLPYLSVYREHVNGDMYRTYTGNPFTDNLVDIENPNLVLSWTKKSLEVLEGSKDAFYNRKDIYEAGTK